MGGGEALETPTFGYRDRIHHPVSWPQNGYMYIFNVSKHYILNDRIDTQTHVGQQVHVWR